MRKKNLYFQDRYRVPSSRLSGWDYSSPGRYFITICTKEMISYFGYIDAGVMHLNDLGKFSSEYMKRINDHYENFKVHNYVVMPNHLHAIIEIRKRTSDKSQAEFGPLVSKSLSSLINQYKGKITKYANENNLPWGGWQERFHDHIIRNDFTYNKIYQYISQNPSNWQSDRYFRI
ncbi:MAG: transposase [Bacteroidales bacterium]